MSAVRRAVSQQIEEHSGPEIVKLDAREHPHNKLVVARRRSTDIPAGNAMHVRIDYGNALDIGLGKIGAAQREVSNVPR